MKRAWTPLSRSAAAWRARFARHCRAIEFRLLFQPLLNLEDNRVCSFEALLRWEHPELGSMHPAQFIPSPRRSGLIVPIGEWVLREACAAAAGWPGDVGVSVNLSPVQFRKNRNLIEHVKAALAGSGLRPDRLEVEITESVLLADNEIALQILRQLKALGIRIAMDDFGTGYSSLSYLRRFPFDKIKIDQSFVQEFLLESGQPGDREGDDRPGPQPGHDHDRRGRRDRGPAPMIRDQGCTEVQGFLLSAPLPATAVGELLSRFGTKGAAEAMRSRDVA